MSGSGESHETDPRSEAATLHDALGPGRPSAGGSSFATISRYLVIEKLGAGAMGVVLRAYDPRLRREVAIKVLHRGEDADAEARMLREAQSMAQLSHPNVVGIYDAETTEYGVTIAMELVSGVPLDRWLKDETRTQSQILAAFAQAGRGLVAAHTAGLIHRDFKPANVFMGNDGDPDEVGRVRVGDFGLARETSRAPQRTSALEDSSQVELTAAGTIMGTPVYMAPEQHLGLPADERSDQFAFCVSLWEALHDERPFEGSGVFALAYAKQQGNMRAPRAKVPTSIQAAIERGLSSSPDDRWPDLASLLEHLEPRRRQWGPLAIATVLTAASIATAVVVATDTPSPRETRCAQARAQLDTSWNGEVHRTLKADERNPERLLRSVDAYTTTLREHYDHACAADSSLSDQEFDATMTCLDDRGGRIEAIVELLSASSVHDGKSVDKMIDSLTPVERCTEARLDRTRQVLPDDPGERENVLAIREEIARIKQLEQEGREAEALPRADAALERAEEAGFVPLLANALFTRSSLAKFEGRFDYAGQLLRRVLELRLSTGDHEGSIAAATQLVYVRGVLQAHYEEADGWATVARGLMGNTDVGPIRRGWLFNHVGASMNARGRPEAAIEPLLRAVEELATGLGEDHRSVADPLSHLANALVKLGRAEEALGPAVRAARLRLRAYDSNSPEITTALLNLARAQRDTNAHEEALATLGQARERLESDPTASNRRAEIERELAIVRERMEGTSADAEPPESEPEPSESSGAPAP